MNPLVASRLGRALSAAVLCASVHLAGDAGAQPRSAINEARELALAGWKALDAEKYQDALDKVTQAEALYHAPTHLLLMGNALAGLGKTADALATFERLAAEPLPDAAPTAFKEAQETGRKRVKELIARVPSLLVAVESAIAAAPTVQVDGKTVSFAGGVAVRLNPGEHTITVTADGAKPVKTSVTLPEKGGVVRVPIVLEPEGGAVNGAGGPATSASASAAASAGPSSSAAMPPVERSRAPAFVAFGVAGAGIIAGAITGGLSLSMTGELKGVCKDNLCPPDERGKLDQATALANASTATFVIGGVAAAAGVVLLTVDLGSSTPKPVSLTSATVQPWISVGSAGIRGRF